MSNLVDEVRAENLRLKSELLQRTTERDIFEAELRQRTAERDAFQKKIEELLVQIEHLNRLLFGQKAERINKEEAQASLLKIIEEMGRFQAGDVDAGERAGVLADELQDELEGNEDADEPAAALPKSKHKKPKKKAKPHGRRNLDESSLPVARIVLEPAERWMPGGDVLVKIGEETSSHLDYMPASILRVLVVRPKYLRPDQVGCAASNAGPVSTTTTDSEDGPAPLVNVLIAPAPELPIPKGLAGPGLIARVLVNKYADHLPLSRQERIFKREGVKLPRSTLCDFVQGAVKLLDHVATAMWNDAKMHSPLLLTDACRVLVRARKRCRTDHFQVYIAPQMHVLFRYMPVLEGDPIADDVAGFQGKMLNDASSLYHELQRREPAIVEVGCWAHARRNFFNALLLDWERALAGIGFIGLLYDAQDASKDEHGVVDGAKRKMLAQPILDRLLKWVQEERPKLAAPSKIEVAFGYIERQWTSLTRYLDDGRLLMDNNRSERALRPVAVGRKNWIFCATENGGRWNATVVSLIASCRMHDIEPWAYLRDVLTVLPAWPLSRVLELAPLHWLKTRETPELQKLLEDRRLLGRRSGEHAAKSTGPDATTS